MRKLLVLMPLVLFTACASKGIDRLEVIKASRECVNAHMKPVIQYLPQSTSAGTITVPVNVNCEVYAATLK